MFEATSTENWNLIKLYHVFSISFLFHFFFYSTAILLSFSLACLFGMSAPFIITQKKHTRDVCLMITSISSVNISRSIKIDLWLSSSLTALFLLQMKIVNPFSFRRFNWSSLSVYRTVCSINFNHHYRINSLL